MAWQIADNPARGLNMVTETHEPSTVDTITGSAAIISSPGLR
jgi:hypothetical protein